MTGGPMSGHSRPSVPRPADISDRADLAAALTRLRESAGLSVRDLARRVDSPVATIGGYFSGRHLPTAAQSAVFVRLLDTCGVTDPAEQQQWWDAVSRARRSGAARPPSASPPYRGLESFQVRDAPLFFGRDRLTAALVAAVRSDLGAGRMVAVVGASGSGKSSLVRAGLIAALAQTPVDAAVGEPSGPAAAIVVTPGDRPLRRLATALAADEPANGPMAGPGEPAGIDRIDAIEQRLRTDPGDAPRLLTSPSCLLVVDQFEEVFSSCPDEAERRAFIAAVGVIAGLGRERAAAPVVIVLRADFYPMAIDEPALLPVLTAAQIVVGPMTADEIRQAVVEPARIAGCEVDDDLVEILIRDLTRPGAPAGAVDAGALPLLSHALSVTWQRAGRRRLTVGDYLATGGITGAVAQSAEAVLAALPPDRQELTGRLFLRLVNVDDDAVVTRRRLPLADLPSLDGPSPAGTDHGAAHEVVDRFVAARLMTVDADSVQVSHEALLSAWPRSRRWIDEGRVALGAHRRLAEALRVWQDSDHDPSTLLGGTRLSVMQESLAGGSVVLTGQEAEFLAASQAFAAQQRAAAARRKRTRRLIVATVTALALLATGLGVFAVVSRRSAASEQQSAAAFRDLALAGQLQESANRVRPLDSNVAAQLSIVAYRTSPTAQGRSALLDATAEPLVTRVLGNKGPTMQALSPDGRMVAVADGTTGAIRLLSVTDPRHPQVLGTAEPAATTQQFAVSFSADGRLLVAGSKDGDVQLWDVQDPAHPAPVGDPLARFPSGVFGVLITPDGRTLLAGGEGGTVVRWSLADPAHPVELPGLPTTGLVQTMSLSPDGALLAVGGRGTDLDLWSMTGDEPAELASIPAARATVSASAFSPDGHTLAVGGRDGAVTVWDVSRPTAPRQIDAGLMPFTNIANVLAFSADGSVLAAGGSDGTVRAWRTSDWVQLGQLGHPGPVTGLAVSADGGRLISSAADGTTRLWPVDGSAIAQLPDSVFSLGWFPDGRTLAVAPGIGANAASLWDVADGERPAKVSTAAPPGADQTYGGGVAVSPDGRLMATTLLDGRVQLWNTSDPGHPIPVGDPLTGPSQILQQVAFSSDGTQLAAAANDASVWLWNVADPSTPTVEASMTGLGGPVYSVAFGAADHVLAASTSLGQAKVWTIDDPTDPQLRSTIDAGESYSFAVAISPDGRTLAVSGANREVRRWDIEDPAHPGELGSPLTGPGNDVYWVDFSPDGRTLAAASTDRNVWLWDLSPGSDPVPYATLGAADAQLFVARFDPGGKVLAAGGTDRAVHRWATDPTDAVAMICAAVGTPLTEAEWQVYLPGHPYDPPCT